MSRRALGVASAAALALAAIVYAACSGVSSQEPTPTPTTVSTPTPAALSATAGPPQVEAGAPIGDPTSEPLKPEAKVVYIGPRDVKAVALTFDTGVPAGTVPQILDTLKEHGKQATFGITGEWATTNPALLKRMVEEGHAVINHSWSHRSFTGEDTETVPLTLEEMRDELRRTEEKIEEIAEVSTKPYFRPPFGDYDQLVNRLIREEGYEYNVLWLVDSLGWEGRSTKSIVSVTLANAYNGAIFLYHTDNDRDYAALEGIIEGLDERGLQMVTIPQLLGHEPMPTPTPRPSPTPSPVIAVAPTQQPFGPAPSTIATPTPTPVPATSPLPTPTPVPYVTLASDDFESGVVGGGQGWASPWAAQPFVVGEGAAHSGSRYLDMAFTGSALRVATVEPQAELLLRFWARFDSLEAEDGAFLGLSNDGENWTVYSLSSADENDNTWRLYEFAVPFKATGGQLFVGFQALIDPADDLWHVDDVELLGFTP